jgi:hypothetical protein
MHRVVKGMVQVAGATYRIELAEAHRYEVVRIADDVKVGSFFSQPPFDVKPSEGVGVEAGLLREIARAALRSAKTSWVGRLSLS